MADPRFFKRAGPFTLSQLAEFAEADLHDSNAGSSVISDIATLSEAGLGQISFLDNRKYIAQFEATKAAACVVSPEFVDRAPPATALLLSRTPYRSFALISQRFYPVRQTTGNIHPSAVVDQTAAIGDNVVLEPGAVVGENVRLGDGVQVGPNAVIGTGVTIGERTRIGANASIEYADIGSDTQIHPGARIGTRGFGFAMDPRGHVELPQLGRVIIGDDVEIGANTTIDRGMGPDTVIEDGCKIDNLVQIGHNVQIGKNSVVAALTGIAGSAKLEEFVICAAKVGIAGHLTIGAGSVIAGMSGIMSDLPPGSKVAGAPASPHREWLKKNAMLNRMAKK